jgi:DNA-binding PadR family transcriptional regulator
MQKTDSLGHFEQLVLGAVKMIENAYAVPILEYVESVGGKRIHTAAVYVTLERLESKGYVRARMAENSGKPGKHPKRFYTITETGEFALNESKEVAARFLESLRPKDECATPTEPLKGTI